MSNVTINHLPAEIIVNILRRVNQDDLKNATLTCKWWKQLAETDCSWSVTVHRHTLNAKSLEFYTSTARKIRSLKVFDFTSRDSGTTDIFKKLGSNIRKLALHHASLHSVSDLVALLKHLPNLEELILNRVQWRNAQTTLNDNDISTLDKLKTLECTDLTGSLFNCFANSKITTLKYRNLLDERNADGLSNFLKKQSNLKTLMLQNVNLSQLDGKMPFQLRKLWLRNIADTNDFNHLIAFMKSHVKTLEVLDFVFSSLSNLKSLSLCLNDMPTDMDFYESLQVNKSLRHVRVMDSSRENYLRLFSKLLKVLYTNLPNLSNVCFLTFWGRRVLSHVPEEVQNKVHIKCFNGCTFESLSMDE